MSRNRNTALKTVLRNDVAGTAEVRGVRQGVQAAQQPLRAPEDPRAGEGGAPAQGALLPLRPHVFHHQGGETKKMRNYSPIFTRKFAEIG